LNIDLFKEEVEMQAEQKRQKELEEEAKKAAAKAKPARGKKGKQEAPPPVPVEEKKTNVQIMKIRLALNSYGDENDPVPRKQPCMRFIPKPDTLERLTLRAATAKNKDEFRF